MKGVTNARRYQLGMPTWRALVGVQQVELVVGADAAQARALAEAVAREAFNNVAFFAGDPGQVRGGPGGPPAAEK